MVVKSGQVNSYQSSKRREYCSEEEDITSHSFNAISIARPANLTARSIFYQSRKADAAAGRKLPELRNTKVVTVSELIDDALEFVAHHKDNRNYQSKAVIVREDLGSRPVCADLVER